MSTTTTIVATGLPPIPPHRHLPPTGLDFGPAGLAGLLLVVGIIAVVIARRTSRRFVVRLTSGSVRPWVVMDRHTNQSIGAYHHRDAAKNRAWLANTKGRP